MNFQENAFSSDKALKWSKVKRIRHGVVNIIDTKKEQTKMSTCPDFSRASVTHKNFPDFSRLHRSRGNYVRQQNNHPVGTRTHAPPSNKECVSNQPGVVSATLPRPLYQIWSHTETVLTVLVTTAEIVSCPRLGDVYAWTWTCQRIQPEPPLRKETKQLRWKCQYNTTQLPGAPASRRILE